MDLGGAFWDAFGIVLRVGVGVLAWLAARHFATEYEPIAKGSPVLAYGRVAFACGVIAFLAWGSYGTHREDVDPLFGGGEILQDFEPTSQERNKHGLVIFLATFTIAAHGTWYGRNH